MTVRVYLERKGNVCLSIQSSLCSCQELWAAAIFICWRLLTKRVAHDHCKGKSQLVEPTSFTHAHWRGRVPCAAKKREGLLKTSDWLYKERNGLKITYCLAICRLCCGREDSNRPEMPHQRIWESVLANHVHNPHLSCTSLFCCGSWYTNVGASE